MQVENRNNYNTLGRMGPLYPRPEYRPPQKNGPETGAEGTVRGEDKKETQKEALVLSPNLKGKGIRKAEVSGKLNLQGAKALVEETGGAIARLSPGSLEGCPHRVIDGSALMWPTYA